MDRLASDRYYASQNLSERKVWYSRTASVYNDYRPCYPDEIIDQALSHVQGSRVLEIGSGPGTASVSLAERGYELLCLEPNPEFCKIAIERLACFPDVCIETTAFEEADTHGQDFDGIVAASCMHWIAPEIALSKSSASLRNGGVLIMLWNMMLSPASSMLCEEIKQAHEFLPNRDELLCWSSEDTQAEVADSMGKRMIESGYFENFESNRMRQQLTYSGKEYTGLLSSYSTYMRLDPKQRADLFERIEEIIQKRNGGKLELLDLSLYHIGEKRTSNNYSM
jgi:SAM-dependent methyltransferase